MAGVCTRIVLGALAAVLALPSVASAALDWRSCRVATGAECATLRVPLDRSGSLPGTVPLKLARLPSDAARPTLVYLSGGPGGAGIEEMLAVMPLAPFLLDSYRVVGFDQRGTGGSGLLRCPALERDARLRSVRAGGVVRAASSAPRGASTRPRTPSRTSRRSAPSWASSG